MTDALKIDAHRFQTEIMDGPNKDDPGVPFYMLKKAHHGCHSSLDTMLRANKLSIRSGKAKMKPFEWYAVDYSRVLSALEVLADVAETFGEICGENAGHKGQCSMASRVRRTAR